MRVCTKNASLFLLLCCDNIFLFADIIIIIFVFHFFHVPSPSLAFQKWNKIKEIICTIYDNISSVVHLFECYLIVSSLHKYQAAHAVTGKINISISLTWQQIERESAKTSGSDALWCERFWFRMHFCCCCCCSPLLLFSFIFIRFCVAFFFCFVAVVAGIVVVVAAVLLFVLLLFSCVYISRAILFCIKYDQISFCGTIANVMCIYKPNVCVCACVCRAFFFCAQCSVQEPYFIYCPSVSVFDG